MIREQHAGRLLKPIQAHPDLFAIGLLLAASLMVRVRFLSRPFHGDELITFSNMVLGRDIGEIIFGPFDSNSHLLNSLIMKVVYLGVGEVPALIRLPNLMFVLLAIVLLYVISKSEFGRVSAFTAALLFSLHPAMVLFSVSARGYAGMVLFTLISSVLFVQVIGSFSWWRLFFCASAGLIAGTFHLFAMNVLVAQVLTALLIVATPTDGQPRNLAARTASMGPVILGSATAIASLCAIFVPQLVASSTESFHYPFQAAFPLALVNFMGGNAYRTDLDIVSSILLALAATGAFSLRSDRTPRNYLSILFLAPMALYALSTFAPVFTLHPRFFAYLLPFCSFLVVAGLRHVTRLVVKKTPDRHHAPRVIRSAVVVCVALVAMTLFNRINVPRMGRALIRAQRTVGEFIDHHPDALLLTNDTGFVRVRLRQEDNMNRIRSALGIKPIRAFLTEESTGEAYFIYVPKKRLTESALIHYQGKVAPDVLYKRDDRLRNYLIRNATIELDLAPKLQIYDLRSPPESLPAPTAADSTRKLSH